MYSKFGQFIDGKWQESEKKETYEVINPANEEVIGNASKASSADIDKALKSAESTLKFSPDNVYSHVSKVLYHYLKDKFSLSTDNLDPLTVYSLLKGKVQEEDLDSLVHILKMCDSGQYAPGKKLNEENLITNVRKLLNRIDKNA